MTRAKSRAICDLFRTTRTELRFTQDAFADELGVSRRTLSRWENMEIVPGEWERVRFVDKVHALHPALGIRVAQELGLPRPGPSPNDLHRALWAAADALNVGAEPLRAVLAQWVQQWRAAGWTAEQVAAFLEEKVPRADAKK
ncbi:MAG TPA: helix-turn-helix transcriptional regulator [Polyangiaceae bacterium]|jgi:transcriptional regulator with XRE-family HTH domain